MRMPPNFKLYGKAKYVLQLIEIIAYYKRIEDVSWWQAHLESRLYEGRN